MPRRRSRSRAPELTIERVLGDAFEIEPSPLQLALHHAARGERIDHLLDAGDVERFFGTSELPLGEPAKVVEVVAGVRSGKSVLSCAEAIFGAHAADLSNLKRYEVPRVPIIAPTVDTARATFQTLRGALEGSSLSSMLYGSPTADSLTLARPDGRKVELSVVPAHRGGLSVRNRWLAGVVLEEVAQFGVESTGAVVNAEEILKAATPRLLPGAQAWLISSPYGPSGLLHDLWRERWGKPDGRTLVCWASTRDLNPSYPQSEIDSLRATDPDTAAREHDAQWLDSDSTFLPASIVDPCIRERPAVRAADARHAPYVGAFDSGTRGNAWTLALGHADDGRVVIDGAWQWQGSKSAPLSPRAVLGEIVRIVRPYGVRRLITDQWSIDANRDLARDFGLSLIEKPASERDAAYAALKTLASTERLELPPSPEHVRSDLLGIRKRATAGNVRIELARTSDGRHSDFAPAIAAVAAKAGRRLRPRGERRPVLGPPRASVSFLGGAPLGDPEPYVSVDPTTGKTRVSVRRRPITQFGRGGF